jgi:hypothetical protein
MWGEEIGGGVGSEFTINVMRMTYRVNETFLTLQILLISKSSANPSIKVIHLRPLRCYIGYMIYKYMHLVVKCKQSNKENERLFLVSNKPVALGCALWSYHLHLLQHQRMRLFKANIM